MTTREIALATGMSQEHIRRLTRTGVLPATRADNGYLDIDVRAFQEWRESHTERSNTQPLEGSLAR